MKLLNNIYVKAFTLVLLVYTLFGFIILPKVAINKANSLGLDLLGSPVQIEELYFNPYSFELEVTGLKIASQDNNGSDRLSLKKLFLNFEPSKLLKKEINLQNLSLEEISFVFELLPDSKTNWEIKKTESAKTTEPGDKSPWTLTLQNLNIQNSALKFKDSTLREPLDLNVGPLNLGLQNFSTSLGTQTQLKELKFSLANQGLLQLQGEFSLNPTRADIKIKSRDLPIDFLSSFLFEKTYLEIKQGTADLDTFLKYDYGKIQVGGTGLINNLNLLHYRTQKSALNFKSLEIMNFNFSNSPTVFNAEKVFLKEPQITLILKKDGKLNVSEFVRPPVEVSQKKAHEPTLQTTKSADIQKKETPSWNIKEFTVSSGRLNFNDQQIQPNFSALVTKLNGTISPIKSGLQKTSIDLNGAVETFGRFKSKGYVYTGSTKPRLNLNVNFSNIEMTTFTPYSGQFAGYEINKGKLFLDLNYSLQNNLIKGKNDVRLDQFTLGKAVESEKAPNLPLKLALALMKDRNGQIKFNLPVEGDVNSPQFSLSNLVWTALKNMLINIVAAPFDFIKSLADGEDLAYANFEIKKIEMSEDQKTRVIKLAKILTERPELKLEIKGQYNLADEEALKFKTEAEYKKWASLRAESILKILVQQQVEPERIFITASQKVENSEPLVKAVISLKAE